MNDRDIKPAYCSHRGERQHVIPTHGKTHHPCRLCWCGPKQTEPGLFVHNFREVA